MNKRLALLSLLLLPLLACTRQEPAATDTAAAPVAEAPAATSEAPAGTPTGAAPADAAAPATEPAATETPAPAPEAADAAADVAATAPQGPPLVAGTDYEIIQNGQPFAPLAGKIEVVEVFNYVCPACAAFQPLVNAWKAKLPADVRFTYVPAPFGQRWDPYVRAYYAAEAMGVADESHDAIFKAIHVDRALQGERGLDAPEDIAKVYAQFGVDPKQFASTMASFAVDSRFNRAKQYILRSGTNSTPTVIVNGKYRVKGNSFDDMLRIAGALVAQERAAAR